MFGAHAALRPRIENVPPAKDMAFRARKTSWLVIRKPWTRVMSEHPEEKGTRGCSPLEMGYPDLPFSSRIPEQ